MRPNLVVLACLPLLLAPKCYDFREPEPDGPMVDGLSSGDGAAEPDGTPFQAATPCAVAGEARLYVADFSYQIQCGCREAGGKTCSVPRGTRVVWQFADVEEHNVASEGDQFGASGERLSGTFGYTFGFPGTYPYGCTIHAQMSGYAIVVE